MNFSNVKDWTIYEGSVIKVTDSLNRIIWEKQQPVPPTPSNSYFYVEDISGSANTLSISKSNSSAPTIEVYKSTDGTNWTSMGTTGTTAITATIPANGKLYLKAIAGNWGYSQGYSNTITASGRHNVGGNIMSLLWGDNYLNKTTFPTTGNSTQIFNELFYQNVNLVNADSLNLPATTLTKSCYRFMFRGCTSLINAPVLPATTMAISAYYGMFNGCTSLTTAPALPATTLAYYCYQSMFVNCTSLVNAPVLNTTTLDGYCYSNMFYGCTSLINAPVLPATTLAVYCYDNMFYGCTSLINAPVLPATILAQGCYQSMFNRCSNLNSITTYANNITAANCLSNWVYGVSATGDFFNLGGATYQSGASGIPSGWNIHYTL